MQLLLNKSFANSGPVTLVKYDVPELAFDKGFHEFIRLLGPIGAVFQGQLHAGIDIDIAYDTLALQTGQSFEKGIVFTTPETPGTPTGFAPAGFVHASMGAGAGIDVVLASATVLGEIGLNLDAFFESGNLRPFDAQHCLFNPITGKAFADVVVEIKVDFGLFDFTDRIPIASTVLAIFDLFKCPPPSDEPARSRAGDARSRRRSQIRQHRPRPQHRGSRVAAAAADPYARP